MKRYLSSIIVIVLVIGALVYIKSNPIDKTILTDKIEQSTQKATEKASETDVEDIMSTGDKIANFFKKLLGSLGYEDTSSSSSSTSLLDNINSASHTVADVTDKVKDVAETDELDQVTLLRIVDGDTIVVDNDGSEEKIRLLEVNTPESVHSDASKNNEYGVMASDFTKEYLANYINNYIYLSYDEERYDQYDRTLAYVWLTNDVNITSEDDIRNYCFNAILLEEGMAEFVVYEPNDMYEDLFKEIESVAKDTNTGLWQYNEYRQLVAE